MNVFNSITISALRINSHVHMVLTLYIVILFPLLISNSFSSFLKKSPRITEIASAGGSRDSVKPTTGARLGSDGH